MDALLKLVLSGKWNKFIRLVIKYFALKYVPAKPPPLNSQKTSDPKWSLVIWENLASQSALPATYTPKFQRIFNNTKAFCLSLRQISNALACVS